MDAISETELEKLVRRVVEEKLLVTPSPSPGTIPYLGASKTVRMVAMGADHGGYALKEALKTTVSELGFVVIDCGTNDKNPVDYPDFALQVARLVSTGDAWRGIMIDGAGIGSCMVANKVPGIRASLCYDLSSANNAREHNDANILTLGAGLIGENLAKQIVKTWLTTEFGGGRHAGRIQKIQAVERQFFKIGS